MKRQTGHTTRAGAWLLGATIVVFQGTTQAGDMQPVSNIEPSQVSGAPALEGKRFKGEIGSLGEPAFSEDAWVFKDGLFASMECQKCGFPKGVYTAWREGDVMHFRTETTCPVTDAALAYTGTVKDGRIEGTYTWTKERWYWTIEKEFWFEGELVESADSAASESL